MFKRIKKFFLIVFIVFLFVFSSILLWVSTNYSVPIIMYHNVGVGDKYENIWVTVDNFDKQLNFLERHKYNVISMDKLIDMISKDVAIPRNTAVLTFDDGEVNNFVNALPVLKRHGLTATFFVPPAKIGKKGRLSWEQLRTMHEGGMDIGSHGYNEAYLPDLPEAEQKNEIFKSKEILEKMLGSKVNHISYPVGGFSEQIKTIVKEAGYTSASTTNRGTDYRNKDVYELNRIRLSNKDDNDFLLWIKFSGYYNVFRKGKNPH
ncbi:MAG: polysaccharide deacetylase family protein [Candidatus Omnitrophica bacterium]|nr:polysaccharide deacetylase family protein [Candidatus Omnitrophota bacterium]MBU1997362.1 polysaccharide deacetylase family protein [Candidatus Omnitrophota bacterium]MBU4333796.1 polysaccharide deacetylase family protein [Candidatus Omnitrophota bacterium]